MQVIRERLEAKISVARLFRRNYIARALNIRSPLEAHVDRNLLALVEKVRITVPADSGGNDLNVVRRADPLKGVF